MREIPEELEFDYETTGIIRKLVTIHGEYLWSPGLSHNDPDLFCGIPISTARTPEEPV